MFAFLNRGSIDISGWLSPDDVIDRQFPFKVGRGAQPYFVKPINKELKPSYKWAIGVSGGALAGGSMLLGLGPVAAGIFGGAAVVWGGYMVRQRFFGLGQLGKIQFSLHQIDKNKIKVTLDPELGVQKVKEARAHFELEEWILASDNKKADILFQSDPVNFLHNQGNIGFRIILPDQNIPASHDRHGEYLQWFLVIELVFESGLTSTLREKLDITFIDPGSPNLLAEPKDILV